MGTALNLILGIFAFQTTRFVLIAIPVGVMYFWFLLSVFVILHLTAPVWAAVFGILFFLTVPKISCATAGLN